jgi:hypothetical protein
MGFFVRLSRFFVPTAIMQERRAQLGQGWPEATAAGGA